MHILEEDGVKRSFISESAIASWVELIFVLARMSHLAEFTAEEKIVIAFVEVNDTETMDGRVTRFLLDHSVNNVVPAGETEAVSSGILDAEMLGLP